MFQSTKLQAVKVYLPKQKQSNVAAVSKANTICIMLTQIYLFNRGLESLYNLYRKSGGQMSRDVGLSMKLRVMTILAMTSLNRLQPFMFIQKQKRATTIRLPSTLFPRVLVPRFNDINTVYYTHTNTILNTGHLLIQCLYT